MARIQLSIRMEVKEQTVFKIIKIGEVNAVLLGPFSYR